MFDIDLLSKAIVDFSGAAVLCHSIGLLQIQ